MVYDVTDPNVNIYVGMSLTNNIGHFESAVATMIEQDVDELSTALAHERPRNFLEIDECDATGN